MLSCKNNEVFATLKHYVKITSFSKRRVLLILTLLEIKQKSLFLESVLHIFLETILLLVLQRVSHKNFILLVL